jgi:dTDP-4-dehydrorhamnose 3,5-epimerase-like enzyme
MGWPGMNVIPTAISEGLIIEPKVFGDQRGFFLETFKADRYAAQGIPGPFVQDNLSRSARGVAVDVRDGSPTFGRHVAVDLSEENRRQLWVPRGFAHGLAVVSESADVFYKCETSFTVQPTKSSSVGTIRRSVSAGGSSLPPRRGVTPRRRFWQMSVAFPLMGRPDADFGDRGDRTGGRGTPHAA